MDGDPSGVKVPGLEPVFRHLDDPDVPVAAGALGPSCRRHGGLRVGEVARLLGGPALPLAVRQVGPRGHPAPARAPQPPRAHGARGRDPLRRPPCPAGTHIELPLGAAFGPFVAGDDGALLFEVMMGDPRGWGDDPGVLRGGAGAARGGGAARPADRPARSGCRTSATAGSATERAQPGAVPPTPAVDPSTAPSGSARGLSRGRPRPGPGGFRPPWPRRPPPPDRAGRGRRRPGSARRRPSAITSRASAMVEA